MRRILVAIADRSATKVLARAADIARKRAAKLELFSVVRPGPGLSGVTPAHQRLINRAILEAKRDELAALATRLCGRGIDAASDAVMDYSISDAIIQRVKETDADLVAIEAHRHNLFTRLLLAQSDYDLIRHCPVPLLIVKTRSAASSRPVLAALDPWHVNDKPRSLDARIIEAGRSMAISFGAALHITHVYPPNAGLLADAAFSPMAVPLSAAAERRYVKQVRRRFAALGAKYRITARRTHLVMGDPTLALPSIVRSIKAQMLVMGAVSRSALKRFLIGSTAERVMDATPCDLLIVKPKSFHDRRPALRYSEATGKVRRRGARG